jgi:capsular polysaccharide biosynthesis protein
LLAVGAAVMSDVLDKSIRDPEQIASLFKTEVMGSLPPGEVLAPPPGPGPRE